MPCYKLRLERKTSASACAAFRLYPISVCGSGSSNVCDYAQVLSHGLPPIERLWGPDKSPEMARVADDGLAEIVTKHPQHFAGWSALLPMNAPEAAAKEAERALGNGANAIQLATNADGVPLDAPQFLPVFEVIANSDKPILLHPARTRDMPDYPTEKYSKYEICSVLGWPYEPAALQLRSSATCARSTPIPLISTSSVSPRFIHSGGVRLWPTPSGVPVEMTSPGASAVKSEQNAMICGIE